MSRRIGERTVAFSTRPGVLEWASVAGKKEHDGPYGERFDYIIPDKVAKNPEALMAYQTAMMVIEEQLRILDDLGIPKEDSANILPLGMTTKIVVKMNFRTLITMSHQRKCNRAYWEFRDLFADIEKALSEYSPEWKSLVEEFFMPKCELYGYCTETYGCGMYPKKGE